MAQRIALEEEGEKPSRTTVYKADIENELTDAASRELLDRIWEFIRLDERGRVRYDDGVTGSHLRDLLRYTAERSGPRPEDVEKFWSLINDNHVASEWQSLY